MKIVIITFLRCFFYAVPCVVAFCSDIIQVSALHYIACYSTLSLWCATCNISYKRSFMIVTALLFVVGWFCDGIFSTTLAYTIPLCMMHIYMVRALSLSWYYQTLLMVIIGLLIRIMIVEKLLLGHDISHSYTFLVFFYTLIVMNLWYSYYAIGISWLLKKIVR